MLLSILFIDYTEVSYLNQLFKMHTLFEHLQVWQSELNFVVQNLLQFVIQHFCLSQRVCYNMRVYGHNYIHLYTN